MKGGGVTLFQTSCIINLPKILSKSSVNFNFYHNFWKVIELFYENQSSLFLRIVFFFYNIVWKIIELFYENKSDFWVDHVLWIFIKVLSNLKFCFLFLICRFSVSYLKMVWTFRRTEWESWRNTPKSRETRRPVLSGTRSSPWRTSILV